MLDIPLLVEGDSKDTVRWRHRLDTVWVVDCRAETQMARVQMRSGWAPAQIEAVITAQASREQRLAAADAVIFNDGLSLEALETEVLALLNLAKA